MEDNKVSCVLGGLVRMHGSFDPQRWQFLYPCISTTDSEEHHRRLAERWGFLPLDPHTTLGVVMQTLQNLKDQVLTAETTEEVEALVNLPEGWTFLWAEQFRKEVDDSRKRKGLDPVPWDASASSIEHVAPVVGGHKLLHSPSVKVVLDNACQRIKVSAKRLLGQLRASDEGTRQPKRVRLESLGESSSPPESGTAAGIPPAPVEVRQEEVVTSAFSPSSPAESSGSPAESSGGGGHPSTPSGKDLDRAAPCKVMLAELCPTCNTDDVDMTALIEQPSPEQEPAVASAPAPAAAPGTGFKAAARTSACWVVGLTAAWLTFVFSTCDDEQC